MSAASPLILALDQSTSATKALLCEPKTGKLIDRTSLDHRQIYPQPGFVEHDAEEIWQNTLAVLKTIAERNPELVSRAACLSITNQRETIVVFDRSSGRPLGNAIVWQCRRGDPICAEMSRDPARVAMIREKTGLKLDTYFSASKLTWLVQNHRDVADQLRTGDALIGTIDAYLIYRLTNAKTFATDSTNACRTLLYNIREQRWDQELCDAFEVPGFALPEVRDSFSDFGDTDANGVLPTRLIICGVMGDSQAALFAHRCFNRGDAKITLGTGSSVLMTLGDALPETLADAGTVATIAWTQNGKPTYCLEGVISYAAATIQWLKDQLRLIESAGETEALARSVDSNGGVYLVPAFAGLSAPHWSPDARAAIVGLSAHSTRAHVVRAALESIAYQLRDVFDMMRKASGVSLHAVHADGGATRNLFLMQFIADLIGADVMSADMSDCSPLGAAMAGAIGCGIAADFAELTSWPSGHQLFRPRGEAIEVDACYDGWLRAVKQVLAGTSGKE